MIVYFIRHEGADIDWRPCKIPQRCMGKEAPSDEGVIRPAFKHSNNRQIDSLGTPLFSNLTNRNAQIQLSAWTRNLNTASTITPFQSLSRICPPQEGPWELHHLAGCRLLSHSL